MDEFKFVLRCFLFATALVFLSQVKVQHETLESKAEMFLQNSKTAHYLRQAAEGGAQVLTQSYQATLVYLKQKMAQAGGSTEL